MVGRDVTAEPNPIQANMEDIPVTENIQERQIAAGQAEQWQPPAPLQAGVEMAALHPFLFDCVWTGSVAANGMGPGSPEMDAIGKATFVPMLDGLWFACDCEQDQFIEGRKVITWKAHFVIGWDPRAQTYKMTYVDSNGSASLMQGHIADDAFICETLGSDPVQLRLTWERLGPGEVTWRNEGSFNGSPWFLIEEYICTAV